MGHPAPAALRFCKWVCVRGKNRYYENEMQIRRLRCASFRMTLECGRGEKELFAYFPLLSENAGDFSLALSVISSQPECRRRRSASTSLGLFSSAMDPV